MQANGGTRRPDRESEAHCHRGTAARAPGVEVAYQRQPRSTYSPNASRNFREIFHLCIPEGFLDQDIAYVNPTPLILSSVCETWRRIAHATPQLWTSLPLHIGPRNAHLLPQLAQEWIDRSGQLPLSINLCVNTPDHLPDTLVHRLIAVVNEYSTRWTYLRFRGSSKFLSMIIGSSQGAPQLQTLKLHSREGGIFKLGDFKPTPTKVEMTYLLLGSVNIEWNNLTHVKAGNLSIGECLELLRRAPQMTHCMLWNVRGRRTHAPIYDNPILHTSLQHLELDACSFSSDFLENVSLPSLKSYSSHLETSQLPTEGLVSFLFRSSCSLETLCLMWVRATGTDLDHLFRATPALSYLKLILSPECDLDVAENFLLRFSQPAIPSSTSMEPGESFLPRLQSIIFRAKKRFDWKLVLDVFGPSDDIDIPHRRPLRSGTFLLFPDRSQPGKYPMIIDKDTLQKILLLVDMGIKLQIQDMSQFNDQDLCIIQRSIKFHGLEKPESQD
ncbi:hypothetical protein BDZ97DRAFT_1754169 [Flammula alnicola]|nr:hypothetical protein BDZ97DRAFT_1754169 [Flammula alnicola]